MKLLHVLFVLIFLQHCSFDNKSGIWKNNNISSQKNNDTFKDFKTLSTSNKSFKKTIPLDRNFQGEPFYGNYRFPNPIKYKDAVWWHNILETSCIGDLFNKDHDRPYTIQEWRDYIKEYYMKVMIYISKINFLHHYFHDLDHI